MVLAFLLNLGFSVFELVGGLWIGSNAILSDAIHDFGDAMSLGLALFLEKKSKTPKTDQFSYGFRRLSLLSALITGGVILMGSLTVIVKTLWEWSDPHVPNSQSLMGMAVIGVLVNGLAAYKMMSSGQGMNQKMMTWHLLEDLLGWVVVLVGGVILHFTQWKYLDSVLALLLSLFVMYNVLKATISALRLFLQGTPEALDLEKIKKDLVAGLPISDLHDFHLWSLDGEHHIGSFHILLQPGVDSAQVLQVKETLRQRLSQLGSIHVTIETEFSGDPCQDHCE